MSTTCSLGAPYDAIVSSLGIHTLVGHGANESVIPPKYERVFELILGALNPGGHFVFADHVGLLPVYRQSHLTVLHEA